MSHFLNALSRKNTSRPPVWFMRQAGRYHSHYQTTKEKYSFEEICKTPKIAAQVALAPVRDFGFDAGILFSDILFILETIGYDIKFNPSPEISLSRKIPTQTMQFQADAIHETKKLLGETPLIGFIGGHSTIFHFLKKSTNAKPEHQDLQNFFDDINENLLENVFVQAEAGINAFAILDSQLHHHIQENDWYFPKMQKFVDKIKKNFPNLPIIYYAQKIEHYKHLKNIDCFGFDSSHNILEILKNHHNEFAIQGNFDQNMLTMEAEISKPKAVEYMEEIAKLPAEMRKGWVNGLGHGVVKESLEENVHHFVKQNKIVFEK
jgi:uroporphyrinogen decarboxylase